jgi:hypothetical protein
MGEAFYQVHHAIHGPGQSVMQMQDAGQSAVMVYSRQVAKAEPAHERDSVEEVIVVVDGVERACHDLRDRRGGGIQECDAADHVLFREDADGMSLGRGDHHTGALRLSHDAKGLSTWRRRQYPGRRLIHAVSYHMAEKGRDRTREFGHRALCKTGAILAAMRFRFLIHRILCSLHHIRFDGKV